MVLLIGKTRGGVGLSRLLTHGGQWPHHTAGPQGAGESWATGAGHCFKAFDTSLSWWSQTTLDCQEWEPKVFSVKSFCVEQGCDLLLMPTPDEAKAKG